MLDFYKTSGGRRFCDSTIPELTRQIKRLADEMHRANNLKAMELPCNGPFSASNLGDVAKEFVATNEELTDDEHDFLIRITNELAGGGTICLSIQNGDHNDLLKVRNPKIVKKLRDNGVVIEDRVDEVTLKEEG